MRFIEDSSRFYFELMERDTGRFLIDARSAGACRRARSDACRGPAESPSTSRPRGRLDDGRDRGRLGRPLGAARQHGSRRRGRRRTLPGDLLGGYGPACGNPAKIKGAFDTTVSPLRAVGLRTDLTRGRLQRMTVTLIASHLELRFLGEEQDSSEASLRSFQVHEFATNARVPVRSQPRGPATGLSLVSSRLRRYRDGETQSSQGHAFASPARVTRQRNLHDGAAARSSCSIPADATRRYYEEIDDALNGTGMHDPNRLAAIMSRYGLVPSGASGKTHRILMRDAAAIRFDGRLAMRAKDAGSPSPSHAAPARPLRSAQAAQAGGRNNCR